MGRTLSVSYDQVVAAANELLAAGERNPGTTAVREILKTKAAVLGVPVGSRNSIQRHLNDWRENGRPIDSKSVQLPPALAADMLRALQAAAAVAREEVEVRLTQVQTEMQDLLQSEDDKEDENRKLKEALEERSSERDKVIGQLTSQTSKVEQLEAALVREQESAEAVRLELTRIQIKIELADARDREAKQGELVMRQEMDEVRTALASERTERSDAQRRADVAVACLDAESLAKKAAEARVDELKLLVERLNDAVSRAAAAEASTTELRGHLAMLRELMVKPLNTWTTVADRDPMTIDGPVDPNIKSAYPSVLPAFEKLREHQAKLKPAERRDLDTSPRFDGGADVSRGS